MTNLLIFLQSITLIFSIIFWFMAMGDKVAFTRNLRLLLVSIGGVGIVMLGRQDAGYILLFFGIVLLTLLERKNANLDKGKLGTPHKD